jgi:hypothetical protein
MKTAIRSCDHVSALIRGFLDGKEEMGAAFVDSVRMPMVPSPVHCAK